MVAVDVENTGTFLYFYSGIITCHHCCSTYRHFIIKNKRTANIVLTVAGVLQTIPTLAVLAIMIPIFGVG